MKETIRTLVHTALPEGTVHRFHAIPQGAGTGPQGMTEKRKMCPCFPSTINFEYLRVLGEAPGAVYSAATSWAKRTRALAMEQCCLRRKASVIFTVSL